MSIAPITPVQPQPLAPIQNPAKPTGPEARAGAAGFDDLVRGAVDQLNGLQQQADAASVQVASGQAPELHGALVTMEEASLALQLALQVRNKIIEGYQEVMRMPV